MSPTTVHGAVLARARQCPAAPAIEMLGGRCLSYGEMATIAGGASTRLRAAGVAPEVVVAICVDEGWMMVVAQLAVLMAGGAFVPVDLSFPPARVAFLLRDSGASIVIAREADLDKVRLAASTPDLLSPLPGSPPEAASEQPQPSWKIPRLDAAKKSAEPGQPVFLGAEGLCDGEGGGCLEGVGGGEEDSGEEANLCWIFYTSGSTGTPKGVLCEHRAALAYLRAHPLLFPPSLSSPAQHHPPPELPLGAQHGAMHGVRVLGAAAFTFDPSVGDAFGALVHGATLCLAPRLRLLTDLGGCLSESRATHVCSTPAVFRALRASPAALPDLRVVALGGEAMKAETITEWAGSVALLNVYGTTEATVYQSAHRMEPGDSPALIGRPIAGVSFSLAPAHADFLLEHGGSDGGVGGRVGELLEGGVQVARGYAGAQAGLSHEKFFEDANGTRMYRTGDLARLDAASGLYTLLGRIDAQVKVNGVRVDLEEIEAVLLSSVLVRHAAVSATREAGGVVQLVAHVILTPEAASAVRAPPDASPGTCAAGEDDRGVGGSAAVSGVDGVMGEAMGEASGKAGEAGGADGGDGVMGE
ncbi:hypothetical protein T484DRAFT_1883850, partial [Baffinella frigidus]